MSPVSTQEFVSETQSLPGHDAIAQNAPGTAETARIVRASFTVLGLALSLGASGSLISSAEAADSLQLAALPSVSGSSGTLPSFGSSRPDGAAAAYHTVADGETIWDIARSYGVSVEEIKAANGIGEGQVIQAGQVLKVPTTPAAHEPVAAPTVSVEVSEEVATSDLEAAFADTTEPASASEPVEEEATLNTQASPSSLSDFLRAQERLAKVAELEVDAFQADGLTEAPVAVTVLPEVKPQTFSLPLNEPVKGVEESPVVATPELQEESPTQLLSSGAIHEVSSGETLWSIAQRYDVAVDDLKQANNIASSLIVPGDDLVIPVSEATELADEAPAIATVSESPEMQAVNQVWAAIHAASDRPDARELPVAADSSEEPTAEVTAVGGPAVTPTASTDPFTAELLDDVTGAGNTAPVLVDASNEVALSVEAPGEVAARELTSEDEQTVATSTGDAINPEFAPGEETLEDIGSEAAVLSSEELLAAAPLGSEVYAPVLENPEGRIVSPEMPILPDQEQFLPEAPERFNGYIWPAQGVLTSGYGWRWGRMHRGVDIAGPVGTPIHAAGAGVVVRSGWNSGGYGNLVDIRHPDGSLTRYAHNSRLLVSVGQEVRQGQQIAEMGSTGYSTGPHLHFEIHLPDSGTVNPIAHLPGR